MSGFLAFVVIHAVWAADIDRLGHSSQPDFAGVTAPLEDWGADPAVPETAVPPEDPLATPPVPKKPPPNPYKGVFYDNDFRYLDDPDNEFYYLGDFAKRRHLGEWAVLDVGGEYRLRQHNERILTRFDNFLLQRTRLYGDLHVGSSFRVYAEALDAYKSGGDLPPRPSEENRFDAQNLFGDLRLWDGDAGDLWFRGGRQELLYGAQRLISPPDWSNTRRTFDGLKMLWQGEA